MRYEYALSDGSAVLSLQGETFSPDDIDDLFAWLAVVRKTVKRAVGVTTKGADPAPWQKGADPVDLQDDGENGRDAA
jgi:hypothetical protein